MLIHWSCRAAKIIQSGWFWASEMWESHTQLPAVHAEVKYEWFHITHRCFFVCVYPTALWNYIFFCFFDRSIKRRWRSTIFLHIRDAAGGKRGVEGEKPPLETQWRWMHFKMWRGHQWNISWVLQQVSSPRLHWHQDLKASCRDDVHACGTSLVCLSQGSDTFLHLGVNKHCKVQWDCTYMVPNRHRQYIVTQ